MSSRRSLRHAGQFDWDGLQTLMLTSLLVIASAGLLLLPSLVRVYRIAKRTTDSAPADYGCLVFGKQSHNGKIDREYKQRLAKAAELIHQQPRTLILLGGHTTSGEPSEAAMGLQELRRLDLPNSDQIHLEEQSQHTLENLRNARKLYPHHSVLISNRYHLARCGLIAESLGVSYSLCAAESELPGNLITHLKLLKEAFFVLWFQVGRIWARLTNNHRMLNRIS